MVHHWPCDTLNTLNNVFVPSGTSLGALNTGLMTPKQAETAGMLPNSGVARPPPAMSTSIDVDYGSPLTDPLSESNEDDTSSEHEDLDAPVSI